jgi:hypothetical protein
MVFRPTVAFRIEAVRLALTSGLPRKQVAADLVTCSHQIGPFKAGIFHL